MPVLPLVGSTSTVLPGWIFPARSASLIMLTPMRSFTLLQGLKLSSLAATVARAPLVTLFRRTSGVCPINSVTSLAIFIGYLQTMVARWPAILGLNLVQGAKEQLATTTTGQGRREAACAQSQRGHADVYRCASWVDRFRGTRLAYRGLSPTAPPPSPQHCLRRGTALRFLYARRGESSHRAAW